MNWKEYIKMTKNKSPSILLKEAIPYVKDKTTSLDVGAGALNDSKYLLSLGFKVIAIDKEDIQEEIKSKNFKYIRTVFDKMYYQKHAFDLVNAQYALPFNGRGTFLFVWESILSSIKPRGIFTGQLFGEEDAWNNNPDSNIVFFTKDQINKLLTGMQIIKLDEVKRNGKLADGNVKYWHYFDIIFRKPY